MLVAAHSDGGENSGFRFFEGPVCLPAKKRVARTSTCRASQRSRLATKRPPRWASRLATAVD